MSTEQVKDYLKYYLGCECMITKPSYHSVHEFGLSQRRPFILTGRFADYFHHHSTTAEIKPILRRLSSITEEEIKELIDYEKMSKMYLNLKFRKHKMGIEVEFDIDTGEDGVHHQAFQISFYELTPSYFHFLIGKGFWLWSNEAFEKGLIIEKK